VFYSVVVLRVYRHWRTLLRSSSSVIFSVSIAFDCNTTALLLLRLMPMVPVRAPSTCTVLLATSVPSAERRDSYQCRRPPVPPSGITRPSGTGNCCFQRCLIFAGSRRLQAQGRFLQLTARADMTTQNIDAKTIQIFFTFGSFVECRSGKRLLCGS
jgi:hypothetical protein